MLAVGIWKRRRHSRTEKTQCEVLHMVYFRSRIKELPQFWTYPVFMLFIAIFYGFSYLSYVHNDFRAAWYGYGASPPLDHPDRLAIFGLLYLARLDPMKRGGPINKVTSSVAVPLILLVLTTSILLFRPLWHFLSPWILRHVQMPCVLQHFVSILCYSQWVLHVHVQNSGKKTAWKPGLC